MKPTEVSQVLRKIATRIDEAKNPDKKLVAATLRKVVEEIQAPAQPQPAKK